MDAINCVNFVSFIFISRLKSSALFDSYAKCISYIYSCHVVNKFFFILTLGSVTLIQKSVVHEFIETFQFIHDSKKEEEEEKQLRRKQRKTIYGELCQLLYDSNNRHNFTMKEEEEKKTQLRVCGWQQAQIFLKTLHIKIVIKKSAKCFNGRVKSQKYLK